MKASWQDRENKRREVMQKAKDAVKAANAALNAANSALAEMQELDMEDLDQVAGGRSAWTNVPTVINHDYPTDPTDPNNPNP